MPAIVILFVGGGSRARFQKFKVILSYDSEAIITWWLLTPLGIWLLVEYPCLSVGPILLYRSETLWDSGGINNNKKGGCIIQSVIGKGGRVGGRWFGVDMIKIHCLNL